MEVPVLIVIQIVDTKGKRTVFVDLIAGAHIHHKELADPLIGKTVYIAIVKRAELRATVTRADAGDPLWILAIARECAGPPTRDVWLPLVQGITRRDDEAVVLLDQGIGIGQAGNQIKPLR